MPVRTNTNIMISLIPLIVFQNDDLKILKIILKNMRPRKNLIQNLMIDAIKEESLNCLRHLMELAPEALFERQETFRGLTLASIASFLGKPASLKMIIDSAPGSLALLDLEGRTAAHWACEKLASARNAKTCVDLIIKAYPESLFITERDFGWTPAHIAADTERLHLILVILQNQPQTLFIRDLLGRTPYSLLTSKAQPIVAPLMVYYNQEKPFPEYLGRVMHQYADGLRAGHIKREVADEILSSFSGLWPPEMISSLVMAASPSVAEALLRFYR
jgi:hypothetical protein